MKVLILEPFYGGSHKQLIDIILNRLNPSEYELITQTAKKWHWRARSSALWFSQQIPDNSSEFSHLFCSSVLNLCELVGLRHELVKTRKVVYFHENQLVYPVQETKDRDYQYGYNEILTALV